jgi:hypothetical protein
LDMVRRIRESAWRGKRGKDDGERERVKWGADNGRYWMTG